MKGFVLSLVLAVLFFSLGYPSVSPAAPSSWDDKLYETFSCREFQSYEPANRPIDFNSIDYPLLDAAIFFATNKARMEHRMPLLLHSRALERAAFVHSRDMAEHDFFSHDNPIDPGKRSPFDRMTHFGVRSGYRAENIALDFGIQYRSGSSVIPPHNGSSVFRDNRTGLAIPKHTYNSFAETLVRGWMESPHHRVNILSGNLRYLGCAAFHYRDGTFYGMDTFKATQDFASDVPE